MSMFLERFNAKLTLLFSKISIFYADMILMINKTQLTNKELFWFGIIFWSVAFTAAEATYSIAFDTKLQNWQIWTDIIISSLFIADFYMHLKDHKTRKKIPSINNNSLKNNFMLFIDGVSCIPFDFIFYLLGIGGINKVFKLIRLFRLVRIIKIINIVSDLAIIPKNIKMQMIIVSSLIVIHWIACGWVIIYPPGTENAIDYYIKCFYWSVTTLTTIGYGDITPTTNIGRIYTMIIMILGVGVYGIVIGNISRIFAESARYKEQTREKFNDLALFMKHYHIPDRLQQAVFTYYNHLFTKRLSDNDQKIISELPHALQNELQVYMNMKLIRNLAVFNQSSQACLKAVAASLEQKFYVPGETIISIGETGNEMFVIGHGIVDVILKDGNTVASLHEGQFFGEAALLQETTRNANVRASTYCDLYKLSKENFLDIIKLHPELLENMKKITSKRAND